MRRIVIGLVGLGVLGLAVFWVVTMPKTRDMAAFAGLTPDLQNGERVFWTTGCASCHAPEGARGRDRLLLSGGQKFVSAFGTFLAPNISSDPVQGIGGWSLEEFVHAVQDGVLPDGSHEFPAMPYVAYSGMAPQDVVDLKSYIDRLPASGAVSLPHEVGFPFNIRRALGGWKVLFASDHYVMQGDLSAEVSRGRYIVESMAHCGECHTPRNVLGGLRRGAWLGGAATPDGKGRVPNITPGVLDWSRDEVFDYLTTGFTPEFDVVGGLMAHVVDNMAQLPEADVWSIVAYLQAVPAVVP